MQWKPKDFKITNKLINLYILTYKITKRMASWEKGKGLNAYKMTNMSIVNSTFMVTAGIQMKINI